MEHLKLTSQFNTRAKQLLLIGDVVSALGHYRTAHAHLGTANEHKWQQKVTTSLVMRDLSATQWPATSLCEDDTSRSKTPRLLTIHSFEAPFTSSHWTTKTAT
jgi:hypothetical protein